MFQGHRESSDRLSRHQSPRRIQSYLDGELDQVRTQELFEHLQGCEHCMVQAETYQALKEALAQRDNHDDAALQRLREFTRGLSAADDETDG